VNEGAWWPSVWPWPSKRLIPGCARHWSKWLRKLDLAELSEHDGSNEALRLRALEAAIGHELRALYELPQNLPHGLLTLLMQLNALSGPD
jgi:hypothetical protein